MKALTIAIQVKTVDLPNPLPAIKAAAGAVGRMIWSAFNALMIILGILAVGLVILMIVNPNLAGVIVSEAMHQMYVWATS